MLGLADEGWLPPVVDGLPAEESLPAGDGGDGMEAVRGLDEGMDGMLLDDEEGDGEDGMLLEDDEDDEDDGIDGIELCEDCWLADSQPARIRAAALIKNHCLAVDVFILMSSS